MLRGVECYRIALNTIHDVSPLCLHHDAEFMSSS